MKQTTRAIHTPYPRRDAYGALAMPVYHCAAYEFDDADTMADSFCGRSDDPDYSRVTNPTVIHYERIIKGLTGARDVVAFNSGMAAISAVAMALTKEGSKIVTSRHLFGNTYLLFTRTLARFGVTTELIDLTDPEAVRKAVDDNTAMIYLETVTNPQMEVADLRMLAEAAHAHGAALVADTTMIPFIYTDAKALGVDVEIFSSTKYLSGGATSLGGIVVDYGTVPDLDTILRKDLLMNLGGYLNPHAAYMQTLGLETLDARYTAQERNAMAVAEALHAIPGLTVRYPGLIDDPYHDITAAQYGGRYGAMLTLSLPDEESCKRFINALRLVKRATNLFDNRTLAIHPASTIFGTLTKEERDAMDVSDRLIRLSIGLEDWHDVVDDLYQALGKALAGNPDFKGAYGVFFDKEDYEPSLYDFDTVIERRGTGALKTDALSERYGNPDLLPMWVADMDFATPDFILDAMRRRLDHPVLGYTVEHPDWRAAIIDWQRSLYGVEVRPEWLCYIPGIVKGIGLAVEIFTEPGDSVIIQPPVYHPFRLVPEADGRRVVFNPLVETAPGKYEMDFADLETKAAAGAKMLILSSPHNPAGICWSKDTLRRVAEICDRHGVIVLADEIHAEMLLWGGTHSPFWSVSEAARRCSITFAAPTKTFNMAGVVSSYAIVPDKELREKYFSTLNANELDEPHLLAPIATVAAYRKGDRWRREMLRYVEGNVKAVEEFCADRMPEVKPVRPDASFLVWLDCRALGLDHDALVSLFTDEAGLALNDGEMFGPGGEGHMRLNVGAPRATVMKALERLADAIDRKSLSRF